MATGFMAQMLDELMGKDRDLLPEEGSRQKGFEDSEVCKFYICGFCPHDLFTNTKMDLGACAKIHDDALVEMYKKSSRFRKMGYEEDFLRFLQTIQSDCERRIKRANQRLAQAPNQNLGNPKTSSLQIIESKISALLEKVETLGGEGKVEEAQGMMREIDQLRKDKDNLQSHIQMDNPNEKQMEVCAICGAFLIVGDAPSRVDDHLKGKQHTGFAKVRSAIAEFREELYGIRESNSSERAPRKRSRSRSPAARRRRRSNSSGTSSRSRKTKNPDANDYSEMLQKESEKRNIQPDEIPGSERSKKSNHRSRSRSRSSKRKQESKDKSRRDRSRSRNKEKSRRHSRERKRTRSKSREHKSKKEVSKKSRKSSRSRSREKKGRRRHSSNNSGERIEVKVPVNGDHENSH